MYGSESWTLRKLEHCIVRLRELDAKKIKTEVFGEPQSLMLGNEKNSFTRGMFYILGKNSEGLGLDPGPDQILKAWD